ncbi:type IV toxin-antitoxin system AbiEi family antitoxin domain-containing protein [soil metagenome]
MLDRRDLRRRLYALAAQQSGHFTAAQAKHLGYSYQAQKYHVDAGNWWRLDRGIFRLPEWPVGEHDNLVRWSLWSAGKGIVSHDTAAALHVLGDLNPSRVHLTVPDDFRRRPDAAVVIHRGQLPDGDVVGFEGFSATSPLRTIFDVAADSRSQDVVDMLVEDALDVGAVTRRQLLRRADEFGPAAALAIERALAPAVNP